MQTSQERLYLIKRIAGIYFDRDPKSLDQIRRSRKLGKVWLRSEVRRNLFPKRSGRLREGIDTGRFPFWHFPSLERARMQGPIIHRHTGLSGDALRTILRAENNGGPTPLHRYAHVLPGPESYPDLSRKALRDAAYMVDTWIRVLDCYSNHKKRELEAAQPYRDRMVCWEAYHMTYLRKAMGDVGLRRNMERLRSDPDAYAPGTLVASARYYRDGVGHGFGGCSGCEADEALRDHPELWDEIISRARPPVRVTLRNGVEGYQCGYGTLPPEGFTKCHTLGLSYEIYIRPEDYNRCVTPI